MSHPQCPLAPRPDDDDGSDDDSDGDGGGDGGDGGVDVDGGDGCRLQVSHPQCPLAFRMIAHLSSVAACHNQNRS